MAFLDFLKPKYKHSNPSIRIDAINKIDDQKLLSKITFEDEDYNVVETALNKIDDQQLILKFIFACDDLSLIEVAFNRIKDQKLLTKITASSFESFLSDELCDAAKDGDFTKVLQIVNNSRCDINKPKSGLTALMWATDCGHCDIVKELIKSGAEIDLTNNSGWTALMAAAQQGHELIVEELLLARANVNAVDSDGWTLLMRAKQSGNNRIVSALKSAGAKAPPGVRWCSGCRRPITSTYGILEDSGVNYGSITNIGGSTSNCKVCGSRLEVI